MIRRQTTSLLLAVAFLVAAFVSLVQPVTVAASHTAEVTAVSAVLAGHGHLHSSDSPAHDPADHVHDVAQQVEGIDLPSITWEAGWQERASSAGLPAEPSGRDRPPRFAVTI